MQLLGLSTLQTLGITRLFLHFFQHWFQSKRYLDVTCMKPRYTYDTSPLWLPQHKKPNIKDITNVFLSRETPWMSPAPPRPTTATNLLTSAGTFYGYLECSLHLEWLFPLEWLLHSRNEHWLNLLSALYNALEPMPCTPWSPKSGPKTKKCKNSKAVISDIFKIDYLETCNPNCAKGTTVPFSFATREAHNRPVSVFVVILRIWDEQACLAPKYYLSFRICLLFKKYIFNYYPKRPRRYWALLPRPGSPNSPL